MKNLSLIEPKQLKGFNFELNDDLSFKGYFQRELKNIGESFSISAEKVINDYLQLVFKGERDQVSVKNTLQHNPLFQQSFVTGNSDAGTSLSFKFFLYGDEWLECHLTAHQNAISIEYAESPQVILEFDSNEPLVLNGCDLTKLNKYNMSIIDLLDALFYLVKNSTLGCNLESFSGELSLYRETYLDVGVVNSNNGEVDEYFKSIWAF